MRGGGQHDGTEPAGHFAGKVVVDGGGAEQDQLWQLKTWARLCLDLLQGLNHDCGAVLAEAAAGDVVVGRHHKEDGFGAAHAIGHELDIVDATFEDLDLLVVGGLGEQAMQLSFVAAIGVDFVLGRLKEVLDNGGAAVARASEDGVGGHDGGGGDDDDARKFDVGEKV